MSVPIRDAIPFKSAATVDGVLEVTLRAGADLRFWERELSPFGLAPLDRNGQASLLIGTTDARFLGLRFQELALAVEVEPAGGPGGSRHAFLWQGLTSRRFFAWVERRRFRTPYGHGRIQVSGGPSPGFDAHVEGRLALRAAMAPAGDRPREPVRTGDETWSGRIHLPGVRAGQPLSFFAHLAGPARVYAFDAARDVLDIAPAPRPPAFEKLAASLPAGGEWLVRAAGLHARSKTVLRADPPPR